jgi:hypothetical protein
MQRMHRRNLADDLIAMTERIDDPQTRALLQILVLSARDVEAGRVKPAAEMIERLRIKLLASHSSGSAQ